MSLGTEGQGVWWARKLTSLSQPPDTMMGLVVMGEKRTVETHSVWPSGSPMVYLHSPRVFHSLMVLSREPDTICKQTSDKSRTSLHRNGLKSGPPADIETSDRNAGVWMHTFRHY